MMGVSNSENDVQTNDVLETSNRCIYYKTLHKCTAAMHTGILQDDTRKDN